MLLYSHELCNCNYNCNINNVYDIIIYINKINTDQLNHYIHVNSTYTVHTVPLAAVKSGRSEMVASDEINDDKVDCSSTLSIHNSSTVVAVVELEVVVDAFSNAVGRISKNYIYTSYMYTYIYVAIAIMILVVSTSIY